MLLAMGKLSFTGMLPAVRVVSVAKELAEVPVLLMNTMGTATAAKAMANSNNTVNASFFTTAKLQIKRRKEGRVTII